MAESEAPDVTITFAGSGDAFGSGGRYQACVHLRPADGSPVLLDCGATSLSALKSLGLDPGEISAVFVSHLHGDRRFGVTVSELAPGTAAQVNGITVRAWEADHPSGAPALLLRLALAGKTIAYTGDTAWTAAIADAAAGADLLIAEGYYRDKAIPYHLRLADLDAHRGQLTARRVIVTHMSDDVLGREHPTEVEHAHDGLVVSL